MIRLACEVEIDEWRQPLAVKRLSVARDDLMRCDYEPVKEQDWESVLRDLLDLFHHASFAKKSMELLPAAAPCTPPTKPAPLTPPMSSGHSSTVVVAAPRSPPMAPCTPPTKPAPLAPPMSSGHSSPGVAAAPSSPPVASSSSVSALATQLEGMGLSPSRRRSVKEADPEMVPLMELSPSKRHRGKQEPQLALRRSSKLCQHADCVFSRARPGDPAMAANTTFALGVAMAS